MNRVFRYELHKGNGLLDLHASEFIAAGVIVVLVLFCFLAVHWSVGVLLAGVLPLALYAHRRLNHGRPEHLLLLLRRIKQPLWNLCERDHPYRRLQCRQRR